MPASYFPLDLNFFDHPKVVGLGDKSARQYLASVAYANRLMTDGFIADAIAGRLVEWDLNDPDARTPQDCAAELDRAVLWHRADVPCPRGHDDTCPKLAGDGWRIHDFLDHNRSKAERTSEREKERERKAAYRDKQRQSQPDEPDVRDGGVPSGQASGVPSGHVPPVPLASHRDNTTEHRDTTETVKTIVEQARPIDDTTAVFQAWQEATGKHRAQLDPKRRRRIKAALKQYPLADVVDAVRGWQFSPHHRGQNTHGTVYNDLDLLLRDAEHLERFRDLARGEGDQASSEPTSWRNLREL